MEFTTDYMAVANEVRAALYAFTGTVWRWNYIPDGLLWISEGQTTRTEADIRVFILGFLSART